MFRFFFGDQRGPSEGDPIGRDGFYGGSQDSGLDAIFQNIQSDMQQNMEEIQQQMEDLMKNFGAVEYSNIPAMEYPTPDASGGNLRDAMLKTPDSPPSKHHCEPPSVDTPPFKREGGSFFGGLNLPRLSPFFYQIDEPKVDRDLDGKAMDVLKDLENPHCRDCQSPELMPSFNFSGQSVTVRSVQGPDGKMEQWRTVEDSSGRKEETCTRFVDGKMHTVTRKIDEKGNAEQIEEFKNMDDTDLPAFNKTWNTPQTDAFRSEHPADAMIVPQIRQDSYLGSIFSKLFGFKP